MPTSIFWKISSSSDDMTTSPLMPIRTSVSDLRIEKALVVLGEAPGREVPAGPLPRVKREDEAAGADAEPLWAVPPPPPTAAGWLAGRLWATRWRPAGWRPADWPPATSENN